MSFWTGNSLMAQIPRLISYQGVLSKNNQPVAEGNYSITLKIFDTQTSGNELRTETIIVSTTNNHNQTGGKK